MPGQLVEHGADRFKGQAMRRPPNRSAAAETNTSQSAAVMARNGAPASSPGAPSVLATGSGASLVTEWGASPARPRSRDGPLAAVPDRGQPAAPPGDRLIGPRNRHARSGFSERARLRACEQFEAGVLSHTHGFGDGIQLGRLGRGAAARVHEPMSHMSLWSEAIFVKTPEWGMTPHFGGWRLGDPHNIATAGPRPDVR